MTNEDLTELKNDYLDIIKACLKCDDAKAEATLEKFFDCWTVSGLTLNELRVGLQSYLAGMRHSNP